MVRAVIFDLDGVVRRWEPPDQLEAAHGLPAGALFGTAFAPDLVPLAVTGRIADEEWRRRVAHQLTERHGVDGDVAVAAWAETFGAVDADVLDLVRAVRRHVPVALLTNATTRLVDDLARLGLTAEFDAVFNSAELGVAKPDPEVFRVVVERLGVVPDDCLLIDDTEGHVRAAAGAGLRTHHHTSAASLRAALDDHDLLE